METVTTIIGFVSLVMAIFPILGIIKKLANRNKPPKIVTKKETIRLSERADKKDMDKILDAYNYCH